MYKLLKIDQLDFPLQVLKVLEKSATPPQYSKGPAWSAAVQKIVSMFGAHIHLGDGDGDGDGADVNYKQV